MEKSYWAKTFLRFGHQPSGHQVAEAEAHENLVEAAVQVLQEAALQSEIGLLAGEQVLHHGGKSGTAARELDHPRGNVAEEEPSVEYALRQTRAEFQVGREVAAQQAAILGGGEIARLVEQRPGGE